MKVIAFKGLIGSGKSTVAKAFTWLLYNDIKHMSDFVVTKLLDNDITVQDVIDDDLLDDAKYDRFATPMKHFFASLLGVNVQTLNNQEFKTQTFTDIFGDKSLRQMHLDLSDWLKLHCNNPDVFADSMKRRILSYDADKTAYIVIDDLRYTEEHAMLQQLVLENVIDDYVCIECKRTDCSTSNETQKSKHSSETEQLKIVADYLYMNSMNLIQDCKQLVPIIKRIIC